MMRSIPNSLQSLEDKHTSFFVKLEKLQAGWGVSRKIVPEIGAPNEFLTSVNLNNYFGAGTKGRVSYQNRKQDLKDRGKHDDHFVLEFDPAKLDFRSLVQEAFFQFVHAFDAYYAYIGNSKLIDFDFEKLRMTDYRKEVVRIYPVNYISATLCKWSFNLTLAQVEERCKSHATKVKVEKEGIFIIVSDEMLTPKQSEAIDETYKRLLGRST